MLCSEENFVTSWLICKWATKTKYHKLGSLEQQKFTLSQFWRPDIQNQGLGRALLSLKFLGVSFFIACLLFFPWFLVLPAILGVPWLYMHQSSPYLCLHVMLSLCVLYFRLSLVYYKRI